MFVLLLFSVDRVESMSMSSIDSMACWTQSECHNLFSICSTVRFCSRLMATRAHTHSARMFGVLNCERKRRLSMTGWCSIHVRFHSLDALNSQRLNDFIWFKLAAWDCSKWWIAYRLHVHHSIYVLRTYFTSWTEVEELKQTTTKNCTSNQQQHHHQTIGNGRWQIISEIVCAIYIIRTADNVIFVLELWGVCDTIHTHAHTIKL